ncbi:Uncharacterised protein [Klebsiella pneumoniae]|uniref:Uncharacterized protein n=1 Tax=Klebsiella pneumoniae TaxID=573 RepID=A0A2X1S5H7_KLEPN|nr:Uncharacterised protein [Klebsiella pneumoniae]
MNLLLAVTEYRPQHVMAHNQLVHRALQLCEIQMINLKFTIERTANAAQRKLTFPAKQVSLLHIRQREGIVTPVSIMNDGSVAVVG